MLKLQDVFTDKELMAEVEIELQHRFNGFDIDMIDYVDNQIGFNVEFAGGWVEGIVKVAYDTDLGVYLKRPNDSDYEYEFDICWCDIVPSYLEVEGL